MKKQKMSVISVFKGEVRLTDERHTIGTNKKLVVRFDQPRKNRSLARSLLLLFMGTQCHIIDEFK